MLLRYTTRKKNGKLHRYWSLVENKRRAGQRVVQRHVLDPGEINERQEGVWQDAGAAFPDGAPPRCSPPNARWRRRPPSRRCGSSSRR